MSYFADKILRMWMKGEGDLKSQRNVVDVLDGRPLTETMLTDLILRLGAELACKDNPVEFSPL